MVKLVALAALLALSACPGDLPRDPVHCDGAGCSSPSADLDPASGYENSSWLPPAWFDGGSSGNEASGGKGDLKGAGDAPPPTPDTLDQGQWYQANQQLCATFCTAKGKASVPGPEGAHCMSGEVRSASGIMQGIVFTWGCFPDCLGEGPHQATSSGGYCYKPGQKKDNDDTDRTVGCFCR